MRRRAFIEHTKKGLEKKTDFRKIFAFFSLCFVHSQDEHEDG